MNPLVSIVTPIYNRATLVHETIASVLAQSYKNWEMIIVDDGSTDNSWEVISDYAAKHEQIKVYSRDREPKGAATSRNIGIEKSTGEFLIFLDADDVMMNDCVEKRIKQFLKHQNCDFLAFQTLSFKNIVGDKDIVWNVKRNIHDLDRFLSLDVPWSGTGVIWRKEALIKLEMWQEDVLSFQDWDLMIKAFCKNYKYKAFYQADTYWRELFADSIGNNSKSESHLDSHLRLFIQTCNSLAKANLLEINDRKRNTAGLFFWLVNEWLAKGNKTEALNVWKKCNTLKLINAATYIEGILYIKTKGIRILQGITRRWVYGRWDKLMLNKTSETFRQIKYQP